MGRIPPPMALSKEEFDKRITNGAKTFKEIDPEFWKWNKSMCFQHKIQAIILSYGLAVLVVVALLIMFSK